MKDPLRLSQVVPMLECSCLPLVSRININSKTCHQPSLLEHLILLFSEQISFNDMIRKTAIEGKQYLQQDTSSALSEPWSLEREEANRWLTSPVELEVSSKADFPFNLCEFQPVNNMTL